MAEKNMDFVDSASDILCAQNTFPINQDPFPSWNAPQNLKYSVWNW